MTDDRPAGLPFIQEPWQKGCKLRVARPNAGYDHDIRKVKDLLDLTKVYTLERIDIGGFSSRVYLVEFPRIAFNSVHFAQVPE